MGYLSKPISMPDFPPLVPNVLDQKLGVYWRFPFRLLHLHRGNGGWSFIGLFDNDVLRTTPLRWRRTSYGFSENQETNGSSMVVVNLQLNVSLLLELCCKTESPRTLEPYFPNVSIPFLILLHSFY
ncbi:hypothetical protein PIB30_011823 [Stylosanthes scabra]|uniref:Uncharacterized protein n=1 Tax=Stylosanthes scabra TaxID=79078 RepID=A0ABU6S6D3_9FABA|nr:hypothetical protein [Stylosanthes scabra]